MNQTPPHARMRLIPDSAPFTPEQRDWLDNFLAELLSPEGGLLSAKLDVGRGAVLEQRPPGLYLDDDGDDGQAPWHDQTLALDERMRLAEGRPLRRRMMAAMGQQDCGQCGYNCEDYADALFSKKELKHNLCGPGGKPTARLLKKLLEESAPDIGAAREQAAAALPGHSRNLPTEVIFLSRRRLNKAGSNKETWHIEIDLADSGIDYRVGDSFGIFPANDPSIVAGVIDAIGARPDQAVNGRPFESILREDLSLSPAPDSLFELISCLVGGERRQKARLLAAGEDPDGDAETLDVLGALHKFPGLRPDPEALIEALEPLQPRLYSIASSPKTDPGRVALCVEAVRYAIDGRERLGVASTFLAERISPGRKLKAYVQKAPHFALPSDPATPIIMIGPGTGIAPFRAFLGERAALHAETGMLGRNWLFFGHQSQACDFFYEEELTAWQTQGLLTRLTLAWSRDGAEKIYVQHRMRELGEELWNWIEEGAHVYVCGDAKRMAGEVEEALIAIIEDCGWRSTEGAKAFLEEMVETGRYRKDVY